MLSYVVWLPWPQDFKLMTYMTYTCTFDFVSWLSCFGCVPFNGAGERVLDIITHSDP